MRKACGDEKTAKWLEENLAIMPDVIRNAQKAAISHGRAVYKRQKEKITNKVLKVGEIIARNEVEKTVLGRTAECLSLIHI